MNRNVFCTAGRRAGHVEQGPFLNISCFLCRSFGHQVSPRRSQTTGWASRAPLLGRGPSQQLLPVGNKWSYIMRIPKTWKMEHHARGGLLCLDVGLLRSFFLLGKSGYIYIMRAQKKFGSARFLRSCLSCSKNDIHIKRKLFFCIHLQIYICP